MSHLSSQIVVLFDPEMSSSMWRGEGTHAASGTRDSWTPTLNYLLQENILTLVTSPNRENIEDIHDLLSDDYYNASFLMTPRVCFVRPHTQT